ncbi:MAG: beta-lactamase family protein [Burkholderiales bacterium]|nr:beta-lactamase family protein [Burkholderiales bacterium]
MSTPAWRAWGALVLALAAVHALAQDLPRARPEAVGMSGPRLAKIGAWLRAETEAGRIPGAIVVVARDGRIAYQEAIGRLDPQKPDAMPADAIFRIYSMTKPITSVAAMILVEEGRLTLDAPVSRFIPEFAKMQVGVEKTDAAGAKSLDLVPARRQITVQDLLRHSSGLTYGFFGNSLVKKAYVDARLDAGGDTTNEAFAKKIAGLPLHYQPGSTWDYSYSTDVLGRVVEVVAGKSLFAFMKERILDPLGMKDTTFYAPEPARQARLAEPLASDRAIGEGIEMNDPRIARTAEPGGQGLVSTAGDYARFLQMLLNGGRLGKTRILGPKTVEFMTADHLGSSVTPGPLYLPGPGYGFGLGFAVRRTTGEPAANAAAGEYNWGGAGGTAFWVDPKNRLFVVLMMQSPRQRTGYRPILRNMVYAAIER